MPAPPEPVAQRPEILARGPWPLERITVRWREELFEPPPAHAAEADAAIAALQQRGSPSHDGMAGRLVGFRERDGGLESSCSPCVGRCGW